MNPNANALKCEIWGAEKESRESATAPVLGGFAQDKHVAGEKGNRTFDKGFW